MEENARKQESHEHEGNGGISDAFRNATDIGIDSCSFNCFCIYIFYFGPIVLAPKPTANSVNLYQRLPLLKF